MKSTLTVAGGPQDGQTLEIETGTVRTLGAAPSASLHVPQGNVAPQHAKVEMDAAGTLSISDLGSATGTYVNGEKISADHALGDGDRICLGPPGSKQSVKLVVRIGVAEPEVVLDAAAAPVDEEPALILDAGTDDSPAIILDDVGGGAEVAELPAVPPPAPPPPARPVATAAKPAPASKPAPPAAAPAPPAAAPAPVKKPAKPDYTDDMPSIVPTTPSEPGASQPLPIAPPLPENLKLKGKPPARPAGSALPRMAVAVGAGLLLSGALYFGWRLFGQTTPPVITSVLPPKVEGGQTVSLAGTGFGDDAGALTVRFGNDPGKVISASGTQVTVTLPDITPPAGSAQVQVTVQSRGGRSNALFLTVAALPRIASLAPDVAQPGDEVTASGRNLGGKPLSVLVGGQTAEVIDSAPQSLRFKVPALQVVPGQAAQVVVQVGRESSKPANLFLGRLPLLIEVSPLRAMAGDRVTLKGRGFDAASVVSFGGARALVFSATDSELVVAAPAAPVPASQFEATVVVEARGSRSNPLQAVLSRLSAGSFTPRYFPAAIPEQPGHVLIATDLGPLLALGGRADAASTVERASRAASALNGLVEQAGSRPVTLEVRDKPVLGIGAAGSPELLLAVTPEDLAAYQGLDPTLRSRRVPLRFVASFWAAMIQDHLSLFVRRERPIGVLELSPRGRALSQIYTEAMRRAGLGAGVPMGVISNMPASLARDLREMALVLPSEGQALAAAAVEGRWEGTLWEEGSGDKAITVKLRLAGSRLVGTLTTRTGGVSVDLPLQDPAYEKGRLRFVVMVGGTRQRFEGDVRGVEVSGSILPVSGGAAVGRFTLKYAG